jgi:hypothetical protein
MKDDRFDIEDSDFKPQLSRLIQLTRILKKYSSIILLTLLTCLFSLCIFAIFHKNNVTYRNNSNSENELFALFFIFISVLFGVFVLFRFNTVKNKGMVIYEELTDEIDWSRKRKEFIHRPPLELRIVIKEFLKATDLPFTTGTNGQAFYIVLFFLFLITGIIIKIIV